MFTRCLCDLTSFISLIFNAWQRNMILKIISASRNARCIKPATPTSASLPFLVRSISLWTRKRASLPFNHVYIINYHALLRLRLSFCLPALLPTSLSRMFITTLRLIFAIFFFFYWRRRRNYYLYYNSTLFISPSLSLP